MVDIASLYAKHASRFDRARFRGLIERKYLDFVLERVHRGARVLDVGCGTGELLGLGYEVVLHREEDPDCGGHTVWVAQLGEQDRTRTGGT